LKKQAVNPKKVYGIDQGFMQNLSVSYSKDKGKILENIVFIELLRRKNEIHYFKEKGECDFIVSKNLSIESAIQVCFQLNEENIHRETDGLLEALKILKVDKGLILTMDQEDEWTRDGKIIKIKPVWQWLSE
jgi:hypothetical protein